jgi:hypothetical protein
MDKKFMSNEPNLLEDDILAYLKLHEEKDMLRFLTCGSVDDGKSTLIGRMLHDSKMIFEDQLEAIEKDSKKSGTQGDDIDLALLVDGLQYLQKYYHDFLQFLQSLEITLNFFLFHRARGISVYHPSLSFRSFS